MHTRIQTPDTGMVAAKAIVILLHYFTYLVINPVGYQRAVLEAGMTRPGHRGLREHGKHLQSVQHTLLNEAENMRRNGNVNHVASAINRPASGIRQPQH